MNKVTTFLDFTAPVPLVAGFLLVAYCCLSTYISLLSNIDKVALVANLAERFLVKRTVRSNNTFLSILPIILRIPPTE